MLAENGEVIHEQVAMPGMVAPTFVPAGLSAFAGMHGHTPPRVLLDPVSWHALYAKAVCKTRDMQIAFAHNPCSREHHKSYAMRLGLDAPALSTQPSVEISATVWSYGSVGPGGAAPTRVFASQPGVDGLIRFGCGGCGDYA